MPASYPNAVKTYTTKSDGAGNRIQADHVNALQDEVTAIEDGLLNGTAPINSSRITAPALEVTNSTVTNATITNATITNCTVASLSFSSPGDAVRVSLAADQEIAGATPTVVNWTSHVWEVGSSLHSTGTNPSRFKAPSSGLYTLHVSAQFGSTAESTANLTLTLLKNSTTVLAYAAHRNANQALAAVSVSAVEYMASTTDYLEARVFYGGSTTRIYSTLAGATWSKVR
jgi:hypothetical protein